MIAQLRKVRFISADSASQASRSSPSMSSSNSAASDSSPRAMRWRDVAEAPDRKRIFVGDEAERPQPRALEPPRQQHAERLMREPAFERIADEIILVGARKGFDQKFARGPASASAIAGFRAIRAPARAGRAMRCGSRDDGAHPSGEIGRERKLAAFIGRHFGILRGGARDVNLVLDQRLVFENLAGEDESVARHHGLDEIFLDLAEQPAAARNYLRGARAHQTHFQHVGFDDGADIDPVALRHVGIGDAPAPVLALADAGEAVIGLERIAAGGDEIDHGVEIGARRAPHRAPPSCTSA